MTSYHVGRLIDHVHLNVADLRRSAAFYTAVLKAMGLPEGTLTEHAFFCDELYVSQPEPGQTISHVHLAFQAKDQSAVQAFHAAALANGGRDNGGPGERSYHPGYYAAFAFDPDGNNIEAVYHGPHTRSAASIELTPDP